MVLRSYPYFNILNQKILGTQHRIYVLGHPENKYRAFDAGEPNHSAGDPILGKIRSRHLENVLIVVIRYFGGVKLGVGGLVQAYKTAAEEALFNAIIIEKEFTETFLITYDYAASPEIMRLVRDVELKILKQGFESSGTMEVELKLRNRDRFMKRIVLLKAMKVGLNWEKII